MLCLSRESNPGPPALQASTLWKEPFERSYLVAIRDLSCVATAPPQVTMMGDRGWIRLRVTYAWRSDRMHVAAWELRITSGSPLCRGLTRAIYILSIEHLRMLCLSRESNPGPPALQASTLWKEPFERPYLVALRDLSCVATLLTFSDTVYGQNHWMYLMICKGPGFLESYDLAPHPPPAPPPPASCLSFSLFLPVVPVELTDGGGGEGEKPNHTTARKSGPL